MLFVCLDDFTHFFIKNLLTMTAFRYIINTDDTDDTEHTERTARRGQRASGVDGLRKRRRKIRPVCGEKAAAKAARPEPDTGPERKRFGKRQISCLFTAENEEECGGTKEREALRARKRGDSGMTSEIRLKGKLNVYQALVAEFEQLIRAGALGYGEKLPSCRALATERGINPNTVERAYSRLEEEGYIRILPKKGAFVEYREQCPQSRKARFLKIRPEELRRQLREFRDAGVTKAELEAALEEVWLEEGVSANNWGAGFEWYRKSSGTEAGNEAPPGGLKDVGTGREDGAGPERAAPETAEEEV